MDIKPFSITVAFITAIYKQLDQTMMEERATDVMEKRGVFSKPLFFVVFVMFSLLSGLGFWQAGKIGPKSEMIKKIEAGLNAPSVRLNTVTIQDLQSYQRVDVRGAFVSPVPLRLFGTSLLGKSGYHLYGLMKIEGAGYVMATPGWIAFHEKHVPDLVTSENEWTGTLAPPSKAGLFTPQNDEVSNVWYHTALKKMAAQYGYGEMDLLSYRLILDDNSLMNSVEGGQVRVDIPNNHLEYAMTWFSLAFILLVIFYIILRRDRQHSR